MRVPYIFIDRKTWELRRTNWRAMHQAPFRDKAILWRTRAREHKLSRGALTRLEWMIWYERNGQNALLLARHYGIAPKTFWKWKRRFNERVLVSLEERTRVPVKKRTRTVTGAEEARIIDLHKKHLRYGKERISRLYHTRFGTPISAWKVQKTLEKYGLYYHPKKNERVQAKRRRATLKKRITELAIAPRSGFLFRLDTVVRYWCGTKRYILTAIDHVSKVASAHAYPSHSSRAAADFLCRLHLLTEGKIENVTTDNESEFHGEFDEACKKLTIPHYWSRVKTPKDNATNERFNRTLSEEFLELHGMSTNLTTLNHDLTEWLIEYNFRRPHQALNYAPPINFVYQHERLLPMYPSSTDNCELSSEE